MQRQKWETLSPQKAVLPQDVYRKPLKPWLQGQKDTIMSGGSRPRRLLLRQHVDGEVA